VSDPLRKILEELVNSNENQILPTSTPNLNEPPDLAAPPRKSGPSQNLPVYTPTPDISKAHAAPRCEHVKPNGIRCGSPALRDETYCYFHRIWRNHYQDDHKPFRPDPNGILWNFPILENADAIQMSIHLVLDSILANKMELKRASLLLY